MFSKVACVVVKRPIGLALRPRRHMQVVRRSVVPEMATRMSVVAGNAIVFYTFFYTMLNYMHYRALREDQERDDEK